MARQKLCFIIGPIGRHGSPERKHADTLFKKIIQPTFAEHFPKFKVERADHISRPGMIDSQVITNLFEAELVIADLTTKNANAFSPFAAVLSRPKGERRGASARYGRAPRAYRFDAPAL